MPDAIGILDNHATLQVKLISFRQVQPIGLQGVRMPGKAMPYFGFTLLIASVFCMFPVAASTRGSGPAHRVGGPAGSSPCQRRDFEQEFVRLYSRGAL